MSDFPVLRRVLVPMVAWIKHEALPFWGTVAILGVGSIASAARDTYGHGFALLGLAWYYRWTNDMQALKIVNETLMFMDEALVCDRGGYLDAIPLPECDPQAKPSYAFI